MPNLVFSLSCQEKYDHVHVIITNEDPVKMNKRTTATSFIYEIKLSINNTGYPFKIKYSYYADYSLIGPDSRELFISYDPGYDIYINDTAEVIAFPDLIRVKFFMPYSVGYFSSDKLEIRSKFNIFYSSKREKWRNVVSLAKYSSYWIGSTYISALNNTPLTYKYFRVGKDEKSELSRSHTLIIQAPHGGTYIHVYDVWKETNPYFNIYERPILTCNNPADKGTFSLEFIPEKDIASAYFSSDNLSNQMKIDNEPIPLSFQGGWNYLADIPIPFNDFKFKLGYNFTLNEQLRWSSDQDYQDIYCGDHYANSIYSRLYLGALHKKTVTVYFPLISLRSDDSKYVGDFESLKIISKFCMDSNIQNIHVHIEHLENDLLIDPVHLSIEIDPIEDPKIETVRAMKLIALQEEFNNNPDEPRFNEFMRAYRHIFESFCQTPFDLYVQFRCYSQFAEAFQYVVQCRVNLITDISPTDDWEILKTILPFVSQFSNVIRISNSSYYLDALTMSLIETVFGTSDGQLFAHTFCNYELGTYQLMNEFREQNVFEQTLKYMNVSSRDSFRDKFLKLLEIIDDKDRARKANDFKEYLRSTVMLFSSSLMLDESSTQFLTSKVVNSMYIVPSGSHKDEHKIYSTPYNMIPSRLSSYSLDTQQEAVLNDFTRRLEWETISCAINLDDLVFACGCEPRIEYHQIQENPARYVLAYTARDLADNTEGKGRILSYLSANNI